MSRLTALYDRDMERLTHERNDVAAELLSALDGYVGHREDCNALSGAQDCDCGFDDLYSRVREWVRGASPRQGLAKETE